MARLADDFITRVEAFADRVLDVAEASKRGKSPGFIRDQIARSGTSVGSHVCEASESLTKPEFCHRIGTAAKELAETKYWLRMMGRRAWIKPARLASLLDEADQLSRILATIVRRSRDSDQRDIQSELTESQAKSTVHS